MTSTGNGEPGKQPLQQIEVVDRIFRRDPVWGSFLAVAVVLLPVSARLNVVWLLPALVGLEFLLLSAAVVQKIRRKSIGPILPRKDADQTVFIGCRVGRNEVESGAVYVARRTSGYIANRKVSVEVGVLPGTHVETKCTWRYDGDAHQVEHDCHDDSRHH